MAESKADISRKEINTLKYHINDAIFKQVQS